MFNGEHCDFNNPVAGQITSATSGPLTLPHKSPIRRRFQTLASHSETARPPSTRARLFLNLQVRVHVCTQLQQSPAKHAQQPPPAAPLAATIPYLQLPSRFDRYPSSAS